MPITDYYQRQPVTKIFEYGLSGMFTIATDTYENRKLINNLNGLICEDNAQSFSEALDSIWDKRNPHNSNKIRQSLLDYKWEKLISTKLDPFLMKELD